MTTIPLARPTRALALALAAAGPALAASPALADAFVLVHGAWHDGSAWDGVRAELEAQGHRVAAPSMPGRGEGAVPAAEVTLADYAAAITGAVEALAEEAGEPVTLVGHSSAGFLIQEAAPAVADDLERIVLTNAFVLGDGQAQIDTIPPEIADGLRAAAEAHGGAVPPDEGFVRGALIAGNTAEEQDRVLALLVPEPFALFATPIEAEPFAALDVPVAFVHLTEDTSLPPEAYAAMAAAAGAERTVPFPGGHEAPVLQPEAFARALLEAAQSE